MISKELMQSTLSNDFFVSRSIIDVPVDAGDDGVVVTVSDKTVGTDVRSDLVIAVLAWVVINGLVGAMIGAALGISPGTFLVR